MKLSIIIPVHNKVELTVPCLESLIRTTEGCSTDFEVVIVDNASSDATPEVLAALEGDVVIIRNDDNLGFGPACNQGAARARGDYLLFLNNDTVLLDGWLAPLVDALDSDARCAAVQPKLVYPDGKLNDAGGLVFAGGDAWVYGKGAQEVNDPRFNCRRAPDYASGACLMVRRVAFEQVGGFDPRYAPAYYEDTDLSFELRDAGWTVLYEPGSTVVHVEGATGGTDLAAGFKQYQVRNKQRFAEKWANELAERPRMRADIVEAWAHRPQGGFGPGERRATSWREARRASWAAQRLLVMDPFPPMFDRASGSLRLMRIERALRDAGHAVVHHANSAVERRKYAAALSGIGVQLHGVDPGDITQDNLHHLIRTYCPQAPVDFYSTVIVGPWGVAEQFLPRLRRAFPSATLIVDSCDLHWRREEQLAEAAGTNEAWARAEQLKARELEVYRRADRVWVVSEAERALLHRELPEVDIAVVGNCHDGVPTGPGPESRSGLLFVGNSNHTPNVDALEWWVDAIAPRLAERVPGTRLTVVGNDPQNHYGRFAGPHLDVRGWVPETLPYLHTARVSVAPLRQGAGVKGKIGEALAAGLPVVTTSIGAEGMGLSAGEDLLVADDPDAFADAVAILLKEDRQWSRLRDQGRSALLAASGPDAFQARVLDGVRALHRFRPLIPEQGRDSVRT